MGESPYSEVVILDTSEVEAVQELAAEHGVGAELVPQRGIEPVATATLVLVGAVGAVGAVARVLEQRKGGQVIDLRPGSPKSFYRTRELVFGLVVIVAVDGTVRVEVKEPEGMFGKVVSTLPALLTATGGGAKQLARAVTEQFGQDVKVDTIESPEPSGDA